MVRAIDAMQHVVFIGPAIYDESGRIVLSPLLKILMRVIRNNIEEFFYHVNFLWAVAAE